MSDDAWRRQGRDEDEDFGPPLFGDVPTTAPAATCTPMPTNAAPSLPYVAR